MGFLIELLVQAVAYLVVELIGEGLLQAGAHGAVRVLRSRTGRLVVSALTGLGAGLSWGWHVSGSPTWPQLLWVSLVLALAAGMLAAGRAGAPPEPAQALGDVVWRRALLPPWLWPAERLVGLAILNLGLAVGITMTFDGSD